MRTFHKALHFLSAAVLFAGLSSALLAQSQSDQAGKSGQGADRQQNETSMTGCLTKDSAGGYTLADEKTGTKTMVTGTADLEKHSANHKVTLTGTTKTDGGKSTFTVTKIQHIAAECKAPAQ
jgi:hypothetical protein